MQRPCSAPGCDVVFEAKLATAKFCSARCRVASSRAQKQDAPTRGSTAVATRAVLEAADRDQTYLGALALTLAARVDETPGSGAASLAKELRATMDEALRGTKTTVDALDELKARRAAKLAG